MNIMIATPVLVERTEDQDDQSRADLMAAWGEAFGYVRPPHMSREGLWKTVIYHGQCKEYGGLSKQTQIALKAIASGEPVTATKKTILKSGAHLVGEWNGRTYQFALVAEGFLLDGHTYGSLTAIANGSPGPTGQGQDFSA